MNCVRQRFVRLTETAAVMLTSLPAVSQAVDNLIEDPSIGTELTGPLRGSWKHEVDEWWVIYEWQVEQALTETGLVDELYVNILAIVYQPPSTELL